MSVPVDHIVQIIMTLRASWLTAVELLAALQVAYPATGWLQPAVDTALAYGKRRGVFMNPDPLDQSYWTYRTDMCIINPANIVYYNALAAIEPPPTALLNSLEVYATCTSVIAPKNAGVYSSGQPC